MKTLQKLVAFAMLTLATFFLAPNLNAQIVVDSDNEVGIGTNSPISKLDVRNTTSSRSLYLMNFYTGSSDKIGIKNVVTASGIGRRYGLDNHVTSSIQTITHYGIRNQNFIHSSGNGYGLYNSTRSSSGNGNRFGIYNTMTCDASSGTGTKFALYSSRGACSNSYAGYFNGNVYVSGTVTQTSDATRKTNVKPMDGALDVIGKLSAKTYDYINDEDLHLPMEKQYGFLAQELEKVLPEIVKEVDVVSDPKEEGGEPSISGQIKSVNYQALIPILVKGVQEQQELIEAQQALIQSQQSRLDKLEAQIKH